MTLDNLRVPFLTEGKFKILSFRSKDNQFKPDPGVVPDEEQCEKAGITVVDTGYQHNDMRDTGPDAAKNSIEGMLNKFLDKADSAIAPVDTLKTVPKIMTEPGPVTLYAPPESRRKPFRQLPPLGVQGQQTARALTALNSCPGSVRSAERMAGEPTKPIPGK